MKKISDRDGKITLKIFLITSLTFTTLLVSGLFAQSYFYQRNYIVYKQSELSIAYDKLSKELRRSDSDASTVAEIFKKYQREYGVWAIIFSNDKITEKYKPSDLGGYEYSVMFKEAIDYYKLVVSPVMKISGGSYGGDYTGVDGDNYNMLSTDIFANGEVLFAVGPGTEYKTPGLVDQYYIYIVLIAIIISILLSFIFSLIISRPLVKINDTAKNMALLDFSRKIKHTSKDELGQLSNSLNTLSEKLDSALRELTAANTQLESDIEKERNLEQTRKEFVANVSHELKTPIAIIKGYAEALKDNIRVDKKDHYIRSIIQEADDMNKLVQDMLDLTRIEAGRYKLHKTNFDLAMLTQNILETLNFQITEKKLNITCEFSKQAIYLYADRIKIGQVVTNFVHNAIRHTPTGGNLLVTISDHSGTVRFDIENEGKNIELKKLDKVWERFYREEGDRNKKTGGTGLGLAISATILKLHNMDYGIENTELGVVFYFVDKSRPWDAAPNPAGDSSPDPFN